jgi:hypothetical protein
MNSQNKIVKLYTTDACREDEAVWAKWKDLKIPIYIPIVFHESIINDSRQGTPWFCVIANLIKRYAVEHPEAFPFEFVTAYVKGGVIYIVTRKAKRPGEFHRAVRCEHNLVKSVRKFDTFTKARFIKVFGGLEVVLILMPPRYRGVPGRRGPSRTHGERLRKIISGAQRRAIDAGLIDLPSSIRSN